MLHRRLLAPFALLPLFTGLCAVSQPLPLETPRNTALFLPTSDLTTNGVPGLTNLAPHVMVSGVAARSAQGGSVALVSTQAWARRFDGPQHYNDAAAAAAVDSAGNLVVVGSSYGVGVAYDMVALKYSPAGAPLWTNSFNGPASSDDFGWKVGVDSSDNIYVAVGSSGAGTGADIALLKYSSNGNPVWTNRYHSAGTNDDYATDFAVDPSGNSYVLVTTYGPTLAAYVTVKYNAQGVGVWTNYYHGPAGGSDYPLSLSVDSAGSVYVTGNSQGIGMSGEDVATVKYSADGTPLWTNRFDSSIGDLAASMAVDREGGVIVAGDVLDGVSHRYFSLKYSCSGTALWTNFLAGPAYQGGGVPRVVVDLGGNVFITGGSPDDNDSWRVDLTTVKLTGDGVPVWTNRFQEPNIDNPAPAATAVDAAGNFYLACHSIGSSESNIDYVTIKYSATGSVEWTNRYDGTAHLADHPHDLAVDYAGNVYITGQSMGRPNDPDFATVKYSDYILYSPPANFVGTDSVEFVAVDRLGNRATASATVTVLPSSLRFNLQTWALALTADGLRVQVDGVNSPEPVILFGSTNLLDWTPLSTNQPVLGSARFLDAQATNLTHRFYRATQQQ